MPTGPGVTGCPCGRTCGRWSRCGGAGPSPTAAPCNAAEHARCRPPLLAPSPAEREEQAEAESLQQPRAAGPGGGRRAHPRLDLPAVRRQLADLGLTDPGPVELRFFLDHARGTS